MKEEAKSAWEAYQAMTPEQHQKRKQDICKSCLYFAPCINSGSWGQGACDYRMLTGHGRSCCPLECKDKGVYVKVTRKARTALKLDWIKRHEGPGGRRIEKPTIRPVKPEAKPKRVPMTPEEKRAKAAAQQRAVRERRKAAGICIRCGKHALVPGKQYCEACVEKEHERYLKRHPRPETPAEPDVSLAQALPDLTSNATSTPKHKPKTPPLAGSRRTHCGVCAAGSR